MDSTLNRTSTNILILFLCIIGFGIYKVNILIDHSAIEYVGITWFSAILTLVISASVGIVIIMAIFTLLWSLTEKEFSLNSWRSFVRYINNSILVLIINELLKAIYAILLLDTELSTYGATDVQTLKKILPQSAWYKITEGSDFIFLLISAGICCYQLGKYRGFNFHKTLPYYLLSFAIIIVIKLFT